LGKVRAAQKVALGRAGSKLMRDRPCHVYILANKSRMLYIGVTSDLQKRILQHRSKELPGFTSKFNLTMLVFYEEYGDIRAAIAREKEIKAWRREKKIKLIRTMNPKWLDLTEDLFQKPIRLPE
jgi:putative endonuclease